MERFEILAGLPPYGAVALPFPSDGAGRHREGVVVRFNPASVEPWVGNFQRGLTPYDSVLAHPDGRQVVIVAGGQGYVIDPEMRRETQRLMPASINLAISMPEFNQIVLGNDLEFGAIRADGTGWNSGRLSWDGIKNVSTSAATLRGEAYSPLSDSWFPFTLDLLTGEKLRRDLSYGIRASSSYLPKDSLRPSAISATGQIQTRRPPRRPVSCTAGAPV